jgi:hypothetical protein
MERGWNNAFHIYQAKGGNTSWTINTHQAIEPKEAPRKRRIRHLLIPLAIVVALVFLVFNPFYIFAEVAYFPVQNEASIPLPDSKATGELMVKNGYLRLLPPLGSSVIVIWPYGYTWRRYALGIEVLDHNDRVVARTGQIITLRGGSIPAEALSNICSSPVPDNIAGPFWMAGNII